jgi:hypothetical protein
MTSSASAPPANMSLQLTAITNALRASAGQLSLNQYSFSISISAANISANALFSL